MKTKEISDAFWKHIQKQARKSLEEFAKACFEEGYKARDAEVERLKRQIDLAQNAIQTIMNSPDVPFYLRTNSREVLQEIEKIGEEK